MDNVRSHIIKQPPQDPRGFAAQYNQIRVVFLSILDYLVCRIPWHRFGLEVQVPEYLETDELIKVNTENGKFMARA